MDTNIVNDIAENAKQSEKLLKSISNQYRLMILCHLGDQQLSVSQLNDKIDISQSALSQHLAKLRKEELVATTRDSQTIYNRCGDRFGSCITEGLFVFSGNTNNKIFGGINAVGKPCGIENY